MKRRVLSLVVTVLAVAALAYAGVLRTAHPHVGAFTLKKSVVTYGRDGTQEVRREIYRRASDGSFRIVLTDGNRIFMDRGFMQGRGFFHVDYESKTLWRDTTQKPDRGPEPIDSADAYTKYEGYAGTDTILGRTAYHLRVSGRQEGSVDSEDWYFPETGGVPVKSISYREDGSIERTVEPYSLEFGEPDPTLVHLPNFTAADPAPKR
jgi:hypothetical protein